jgi:hypothetical protein
MTGARPALHADLPPTALVAACDVAMQASSSGTSDCTPSVTGRKSPFEAIASGDHANPLAVCSAG